MTPPLKFIVFFALISLAVPVYGQYYNTGQDPASVNWLRIKTNRFDVIYPSPFGQAGIDFARSLESSAGKLTGLFPDKKYRIPVVIHSQSIISNGYVAWAPKRMEIYPAPDQDALPGDQFGLLTIHELTHVYEMLQLNTGFSRAMSYVLGEQFTGITSALLPMWYLEGQAVVSETVFTYSGRGRSPSFMKEFKALTTSGDRYYSYDKIQAGSFRDYVPDHYKTGYQMVAWSMAKHGNDLWNKVLNFTGNEPFTIIPVNIGLSRNAHLTKKRLYRETFDTLKSIWTKELKDKPAYSEINPGKNGNYVNYYSPAVAGTDSIISIKTSLSSAPEIILTDLKTQKEKIISRPGYMYPFLLSQGGGKVVWIEERPDPRWENRNYSVIRLHDMRKGTTRTLTHKTRYLSASISKSGQMIAAVEYTQDNKNNLLLIDPESEIVIERIPSPSNYYLQRPSWSDDGKAVTVIYLTEEGEGVMSWQLIGKKWKTELEAGSNDIRSAFLQGNSLYFVSGQSGTDNVFKKTGADGIVQVTDSRYGVSDPVGYGDGLIFSDYTASGNTLCMASSKEKTRTVADTSSFIINRIKIHPGVSRTSGDFTPSAYRKSLHLFRFHSWMPFYADISVLQTDPLAVRPGLTLMSQNSLSTLTSTLGYEYSVQKKHLFHSTVTWAGWYPEIKSKLTYGQNQRIIGTPRNTSPGLNFSNEIFIPLRYSSGNFSQFIRPSVDVEYSNNIYSRTESVYDYGQTTINWRLYFSNYNRAALRDIYSRWAQTIDLNYISSPFDSDIFGSSFFVRTSFNFPGFFRNNSFRIKFEKEKQNQSTYIFGNRVSFPRGYNKLVYPQGYENIISDKLSFFSGEYIFPIIYPDWNIPSVFFLKRIRSTLFYDYATGKNNRYFIDTPMGKRQITFIAGTKTYTSYGVELLADFNLLRIPFMISGGVQAAWKTAGSAPVFKALLNIDLYGFSIGRK